MSFLQQNTATILPFQRKKIFNDDLNVAIYRKELKQITGSFGSTILLSQIVYWAELNNFKPFYKFIQAPKRKQGESDKDYKKRTSRGMAPKSKIL